MLDHEKDAAESEIEWLYSENCLVGNEDVWNFMVDIQIEILAGE